MKDPRLGDNCRPGIIVKLRTGEVGKVVEVLSKLSHHPQGIKVGLDSGLEGRVKEIIESEITQEKLDKFPDESKTVEYKASFAVPIETFEEIKSHYNLPNDQAVKGKMSEIKDKLRLSALKTFAAFANTDGGTLYIGIKDRTREVLGLDLDYREHNIGDGDGLITEFYNQLKKYFKDNYGGAHLAILEMKILKNSDKKEYLKIRIKPVTNTPLSIKFETMLKNEKIIVKKFYYRTDNGSEELPVEDFFQTHWPDHIAKYN